MVAQLKNLLTTIFQVCVKINNAKEKKNTCTTGNSMLLKPLLAYTPGTK
jgi:hypothetical protein